MTISGYCAQIYFSSVSQSSVLEGRLWLAIDEMSDVVDIVSVLWVAMISLSS